MTRRGRAGPIVHLSTGRPPDETRTYEAECRTLYAAGYAVCYVTPGDVARDDGVQVVPVRPPQTRAQRMVLTPWIVVARAWRLRPSAWHLHDANLLLPGLLLRLLGQQVVYDAHEILASQVRDRTWIPSPLRALVARLVGLLERLAVRVCSATIFAEPAAAAEHPAGQAILVRNFPRPQEYEPPARRENYVSRDAVAVYIGDITHTRGAVEIVEAVGLVPASLAARLRLAGRINISGLAEELEALEAWEKVDFAGWAGRADVRSHLASARVGLAVLHPTEQYLQSVPTKLFEYMAAGLPVIVSDFAEWRPYVAPFQCGLLVDPHDVAQIAEAVGWVLSNPEAAWAMGRRGRRAVEERFSWDTEAARLLDLYERLLGAPAVGRRGP